MRPIRAAPVSLLVFALACACTDSDDRLRQQVRQQVETNLAERDDIPAADREAAAGAIAEDVVRLRREFEYSADEAGGAGEPLEQQTRSPDELAAEDCRQRRLELDALRRLEADPESIDAAQRRSLPAEIRSAEAGLAERCADT